MIAHDTHEGRALSHNSNSKQGKAKEADDLLQVKLPGLRGRTQAELQPVVHARVSLWPAHGKPYEATATIRKHDVVHSKLHPEPPVILLL